MKTVLLLAALSSCVHIPQAGDICGAGQAYCSGTTSALVCTTGVLAPYGCHGPKGCAPGAGRTVQCDQSAGAHPGDTCAPEYTGRAQCPENPTGYLVCAAGLWIQLACSGTTTCHTDPAGVGCR